MCFLLFEKFEVTAESIAQIEKQEDSIYGEEIVENNEAYVEQVDDEEIKAALLVIFMNNLGLKLDEINQ